MGAVYITGAEGQRGGLGFICTAGVLQPEGRPLTLDSMVPLELGDTVPQLQYLISF